MIEKKAGNRVQEIELGMEFRREWRWSSGESGDELVEGN